MTYSKLIAFVAILSAFGSAVAYGYTGNWPAALWAAMAGAWCLIVNLEQRTFA